MIFGIDAGKIPAILLILTGSGVMLVGIMGGWGSIKEISNLKKRVRNLEVELADLLRVTGMERNE